MIEKKIIILLAVCLFGLHLSAQVEGGKFEKLAKLYNAGKYEDCFYKAENYTYSEKTKKEAEPFLYMSMCLVELSQIDDEFIQEEFRKPIKQAVKYTGKFVKKDKKNLLYSNNIGFVNEIKKQQVKVISEQINDKNFRKAASAITAYAPLNRQKDFLLLFYQGICEVLSNNLSQGERNIETATVELKIQVEAGKVVYDKHIKPLIIKGCASYIEYLLSNNQKQEAQNTLAFIKQLFPSESFPEVE